MGPGRVQLRCVLAELQQRRIVWVEGGSTAVETDEAAWLDGVPLGASRPVARDLAAQLGRPAEPEIADPSVGLGREAHPHEPRLGVDARFIAV